MVVVDLHVGRGLSLFCDVTIVSPISRNGAPRSRTSNQSGKLLERAEIKNNGDYAEVITSGLGTLLCLGAE
eukprot:9478765-Pyramimonas_sp.AAC.1